MEKKTTFKTNVSSELAILQLSNDRKTLSIRVLASTFNIANTQYHVVVGDDALNDLSNDQPLMGIHKNIWKFATGKNNINNYSYPPHSEWINSPNFL